MYSPERDPLGSSDNPITKPQKEWRQETQDNFLSPENQTALRELLTQYIRAKKKDDQYQMGMAASEITELTGKTMADESDVDALVEAFGMKIDIEEATPREKEASLKYQKNIEELEDQKEIVETTGREKSRHGTELPIQVGSAPERNLPSKISRITDKDKRQMRRGEQQRRKNTNHPGKPSGRRRTNEQKPILKDKISRKRKAGQQRREVQKRKFAA